MVHFKAQANLQITILPQLPLKNDELYWLEMKFINIFQVIVCYCSDSFFSSKKSITNSFYEQSIIIILCCFSDILIVFSFQVHQVSRSVMRFENICNMCFNRVSFNGFFESPHGGVWKGFSTFLNSNEKSKAP